ncbi:MAG: helix-turn-helix domain-containing protein [Deltaproteobacteria bacterium]|nr:helix-turn-helix domain-containing protein [Deltaproteobacteria bacterium]
MTTEKDTDSTTIDLKKAREDKGLGLKDLYAQTRISVVNLEAIEKGAYHLLPVPLYARNFIKMYADALGVDSRPILQRYEDYLQSIQVKEKADVLEESPRTPFVATVNRHKATLWVLGIIVVIAAVSFFVTRYNKPETDLPHLAEAPKSAPVITEAVPQKEPLTQEMPLAIPLPAPGNSPTLGPADAGTHRPAQNALEAQATNNAAANTSPPKDESKIEALIDDEESSLLIARATEETWIRIQADNKASFQVLLKPGESFSYKAARFSMDIGNAGGVKIQFKGKTLENLGKSGQVIHLRLP